MLTKKDTDYYEYEKEVFANCDLFWRPLTDEQAKFFTEKLCEAFNLPLSDVTFKGRKYHTFIWDENRISYIPGEVRIGYTCHEVAHFKQYHETGKTRHDSKLIYETFTVMTKFREIEREHHILYKSD